MTKPIAIIAGEPNSISSEIIFKSWKLRKRYIHKPFDSNWKYSTIKFTEKKIKISYSN